MVRILEITGVVEATREGWHEKEKAKREISYNNIFLIQ